MHAVILPPSGELDVVEKPEGQDTLTWLQSLVGGNIEHLSTPWGPHADAWINEEGKLIGLHGNAVATTLYRQDMEDGLTHDYLLGDGDYIAGTIVFTGPPTDEGETQGLEASDLGVGGLLSELSAFGLCVLMGIVEPVEVPNRPGA